jgi:predicted PurR-regulated permease PerM
MTLTPTQRRTLAWLAIAAAGVLLLWLLAPVLTPFLIGAVLAYALHPLVEQLVARRVPRVLAVIAVEVAVIVALLALLLLIVPILSRELPLLREQIPLLAAKLNDTLVPWLAQFGVNVSLDIASIKAFVVKYLDANLEDWLAAALASARIGGSFALAIVGNAVLVPVVLFFLLLDWGPLVERTRDFVPPRARASFDGFMEECDAVLGQYLRGQLLVMLVLAVYYTVALALGGLDLALPVGVFTGLGQFIPYLGFGFGLALALLAAVLEFASWYAVALVAVVYGIGQLVESFVLTPRLVGERIGLSPLAVIFALLAFGHLLGFAGVLVALPLAAVTTVGLRRLRLMYLASPLYTG